MVDWFNLILLIFMAGLLASALVFVFALAAKWASDEITEIHFNRIRRGKK